MGVDGAVPHSLVEGGEIETGVEDGVSEQDQFSRAAGGAEGMAGLEKASSVGGGRVDGISGRVHRASARKDGDFGVFDSNLHSSLPVHVPSVRGSTDLMKSEPRR